MFLFKYSFLQGVFSTSGIIPKGVVLIIISKFSLLISSRLRKNVFVEQTADNIYYLDASLLSNALQLEVLLSNEEIEIEEADDTIFEIELKDKQDKVSNIQDSLYTLINKTRLFSVIELMLKDS